METLKIKKALSGMALGMLTFLLFFSFFVASIPVAQAAEPLFSITLLAPTTNPVRRQHAALIANALQSVGVNARVVYVTFTDLQNRLFPANVTMVGKTFDQGGYDIGFIGWGFTAPVPDIKSQYLGSAEAFPPTGNNYALYNSSVANALLQQIYTTSDSTLQLNLFKQLSVVLNKDKPYMPVYITSDIVARNPAIKIYGDKGVFSTMATPFNDLQYMSGVTTYTFAEAGAWPSLAPWQTTQSNSFYCLFVYGVTQGGLQLVDTRTNTMFKAEAEKITATADSRMWTVQIKPGILFHDGVEATADDYLFTELALMTPDVASVGLSDKLDRFGKLVSFTWLDGSTTWVDNSGGTLTEPTSSFTAIDKYTYQFTIGPTITPYAFLNLTETAIAPLPKHYLEQFPFSQWSQLPYATGVAGAYQVTWNATKYGGTGSYTAYGPFGTGPYVYKGFDAVGQVARLEKFNDYWDRARLESLGYFTVKNYNVVVIVEKDAAIAAYRNGEVDALDVNYQLAADQSILRSLGANVFVNPEIGWQEFGINMQHPIVGTGLQTPLGKTNPSKAAEAARHVRQAISYLVPRELVVNQLLVGAAEPGTTVLKAFGVGFQDASVTLNPYDPNLARAELAAAGYSTGVSPITPITPAAGIEAYYIYGQAVPIEGIFKNPITNAPYVNFVVKIQESANNQTWIDTGYAPLTDATGKYHAMIIPDWPTTYVRVSFTGHVVSTSISGTWPIVAGSTYDDLVKAGKVQQILPPQVGPVQKITLRTQKDIIADALKPAQDQIATLQTQNTAQSTSITNLQNQVGSLTTYLYAAIGLAIVSLAVAVVAIMRKSS